MKKAIEAIFANMFLAILLMSSLQLKAQAYRILPLGNSITEGYDGSGPTESQRISYRKDLHDRLTDGGYDFDFVGHKNSGYDILSDADHCGIPGTRAQYVVRLLQNGFDERWGEQVTPDGEPYLDFYPADIILLHIGTNDITQGEGSSAADVENILDEIDAWETASGTHATVFVARIIQRTDNSALNVTTTQLNDNVAIMVAGRGDPGIFMVNIETGAGINYATELLVDGIHPAQSAYDKMGQKWFSILNSYLSSIPKAPTGLSLSGETSYSIDISWIDHSSNETGFQIERSLTSSGGDFVLIHTTAQGVTSYTDGSLDANTQYYYRVRAVNATGPSLYSSIEDTYTLLYQLEAPTGLSASTTDEHSIQLTWSDNAENETGYTIERSNSSGTGFIEVHTTAENATSYTDDGLADGTRYFYRVCAIDVSSHSDYSNESSAVTILATPTGLSASVTGGDSIVLSWEDNSESETGYKIERSPSSGSGYAEIHITTANATTYSDVETGDEIIYFYRVCATGAWGDSDYSNEASANIELSAPTELTAGVMGESSIMLSWEDNTNNETGYSIERSLSTGSGYTVIGLTSADAIFYLDNSLAEGTEYFYRVCATRAAIISDYSNETSAVTALAAPTELSASAADERSIQLSWEDNSGKETGYRIERSLSSGTGYMEMGFTSSDVTSYNDTGLVDGREYFYRIRAFSTLSSSDYSNMAGAATELKAPTNLSALALDASSIILSWTDNSESETGYRIERSMGPGSEFAEIEVASVNANSYKDEGLEDDTEYFYRICATSALGDSDYSNEASAITKMKEPPYIPEFDSLFTFYPNPSNGNIIVSINSRDDNVKSCYLRLSDFSGRVLFYREIDLTDGELKKVIEIQIPAAIINGFYSLSLIIGDTSVAEKFVLMR